ncbi:MAG: DNA repair protein RecN, partial [Anaerolineales bacterium]
MLLELNIKDFAIIDELILTLDEGLIIFTGETGAGKSIIIDAVEVLLGGRAESAMIRTGADTALIEGTFQLPSIYQDELLSLLSKEELLDDTDTLVLNREIRTAGRNVSRINGRSVSTAFLRQIGEYLIDIHGQSEHLSLLKVSQQIDLLDRYASTNNTEGFTEQASAYRKVYDDLQYTLKEIANLQQSEKDAARLSDLLRYQITEIETASLLDNEDLELKEEHNRLANSEGLAKHTKDALDLIDRNDQDIPDISELLGQLSDSLLKLQRLDPSKSDLLNKVQALLDQTSELTSQLYNYLDKIEFNPARLAQVETRLALVESLKKKYGGSISEVNRFGESAKEQLESITNTSEKLDELRIKQKRLQKEISKLGQTISEIRQKTAKDLETKITAELKTLQMAGAQFKVTIEQQPDPNGIILDQGDRVAYYPNGIDQVEFLVETNPGEGFKPLAKIASGGETSRLMLALKYILANADH